MVTRCYTYVESGSRGDAQQIRWKAILREVIESTPCDYCKAPAGQQCRTANGFTAFYSHSPRFAVAHRLSRERVPAPEPSTDEQGTGYIRLYSDRGGPTGWTVPCRYRLRFAQGTMLVDYAIPPDHGPVTTWMIPRDDTHPRDRHVPTIFTDDGMLVTVLWIGEKWCAGVGSTYSFQWDRQVDGWWCSPGW